MRWEMGTLISNYTHIKDGVDLKARFLKVLDDHPFANMWSNAAKKVIAGEQGGISKDVEWNGGGSFSYAGSSGVA